MTAIRRSINPMTLAMAAASVPSDTVLGGGLFVEWLNTASDTDGLVDCVESVRPRGTLESGAAETVLITVLAVVNIVSMRGSFVEV